MAFPSIIGGYSYTSLHINGDIIKDKRPCSWGDYNALQCTSSTIGCTPIRCSGSYSQLQDFYFNFQKKLKQNRGYTIVDPQRSLIDSIRIKQCYTIIIFFDKENYTQSNKINPKGSVVLTPVWHIRSLVMYHTQSLINQSDTQ